MPSGIATFLSRAGCPEQRLANECPECFVSPAAAVGRTRSRTGGSVPEEGAALGEVGYEGRDCREPPARLAGWCRLPLETLTCTRKAGATRGC